MLGVSLLKGGRGRPPPWIRPCLTSLDPPSLSSYVYWQDLYVIHIPAAVLLLIFYWIDVTLIVITQSFFKLGPEIVHGSSSCPSLLSYDLCLIFSLNLRGQTSKFCNMLQIRSSIRGTSSVIWPPNWLQTLMLSLEGQNWSKFILILIYKL